MAAAEREGPSSLDKKRHSSATGLLRYLPLDVLVGLLLPRGEDLALRFLLFAICVVGYIVLRVFTWALARE